MNVEINSGLPKKIILLLLGLLVAGTLIYAIFNISAPTSKKANLSELYSAEEGSVAVICNGEITNVRALVKNQKIYIKLGVVTDELDSHFYYESNSERLLYTDASGVHECDLDETLDDANIIYDIAEDSSADGLSADDRYYVLLDYIEQYSNLSFELYQNPSRLFIRSFFGECKTATTDGSAAMRVKNEASSEIVENISSGTKVWVISEDGEWCKCYAGGSYGYSGYINVDDLSDITTETVDYPKEVVQYNHADTREPISVVWHQVFTESGKNQIADLLTGVSGVDVICPTWFTVTSSDGSLSSRVSSDYVKTAKNKGYQVWALVENLNTSVSLDYSSLFGKASSREKMINTIIKDSLAVGVTGINVDFEGLPVSAGKSYVQFVRELALECQDHDLLLSVDCYVPSAWTEHYHRRDVAEACDYFIIMSYDEHYKGSEQAGSTASLPFVKKAIENTIAQGVPENKIINAIPFYSRLWVGNDNSLSSSTINMTDMRSFMSKYGQNTVWLEDECQYYIETYVDGELNRLWVEETRSIQEKISLMLKYKLAGIACWKLGSQTSDVWSEIAYYKQKAAE